MWPCYPDPLEALLEKEEQETLQAMFREIGEALDRPGQAVLENELDGTATHQELAKEQETSCAVVVRRKARIREAVKAKWEAACSSSALVNGGHPVESKRLEHVIEQLCVFYARRKARRGVR